MNKEEAKAFEPAGTTIRTYHIKTKMTLGGAVSLAANQHRGQVDLGGHPYILHLMRVSNAIYKHYGEDMAIAGILHDILEDTLITYKDLQELRVPQRALEAILTVSRCKSEGEPYRAYIERVAAHADRAVVDLKLCDLYDNLDTNRLSPELVYRYRSLFRREARARNYLLFGRWE